MATWIHPCQDAELQFRPLKTGGTAVTASAAQACVLSLEPTVDGWREAIPRSWPVTPTSKHHDIYPPPTHRRVCVCVCLCTHVRLRACLGGLGCKGGIYWVETLAAKPDDIDLIPGATWQREGTNRLSSDLHMHTLPHVPPPQ